MVIFASLVLLFFVCIVCSQFNASLSSTLCVIFGAVAGVVMLLFFIQLAFYAMLLGGIAILLLVLFAFFRDRRRL